MTKKWKSWRTDSVMQIAADAITREKDREILLALSSYSEPKYKGVRGYLKRKMRVWLGIEDLSSYCTVHLTLRLERLEGKNV